jgi:iron complex transport system permease protein
MLLLVLVFGGCFFVSFCVGRYGVPLPELIKIFASKVFDIGKTWTENMERVAINIRLPRILSASLVGAALSAAGCVYQGMFKNPMVSPDVLGSSAGACFGAALGIMLGLGYVEASILSFALGLLAVLIAMALASRFKESHVLGMVLSGIMIGSLFQAMTSYLKLVADPTDQLPAITYWLMGSLGNIRMSDLSVLLPVMLVGFVPLFLLRWRLNVATLGEEEARAIGVNIKLLRGIVVFCATLLTSSSVAVSGMIGWVGLVIPHFARQFIGCDYRTLLPAAMLMGASFLIVVDDIARAITTSELPIGILTAFVGAPFFLYLFFSGKRRRT